MASLTFKGKGVVQNYHLTVPYHELVPQQKKGMSKHPSLDDNLIVHGDNLTALKALLPTYAGRVKCIYIDPPYNTGNEKWAYNDNVNSPMMQDWLGKVVDKDDLTRHDKWLCMMLPRLKLLCELLREDGVIFVSIDDNEVARLRMLMDEIFGEGNFIGGLIHQRAKGGGQAKYIVKGHDYILAYAKELNDRLVLRRKKVVQQAVVTINGKEYIKNDDVIRKTFGKYDKSLGDRRCHYEEIERYKGIDKKKEVDEKIKIGELFLEKIANGNHILYELVPVEDASSKLYSIIRVLSEEGKNDLEELGIVGLEYPKPVDLVKQLIESVTFGTKGEQIILDSFAGSGTTAHAVLALNKEDGGNRKFILVECEEYADTITAERVRRVIKGVPQARDEHHKSGWRPKGAPLQGTFSYFTLGKSIEVDGILTGAELPSYLALARYVFYTATGKEFDAKKVKEDKHFIGSTAQHDVYLIYKPEVEFLKSTALTLERARALGTPKAKRRLVFAPTKYLNQEQCNALQIDFAQLPFEIYRMVERA